MGPADLTAEELAERVGVSVGRIDRLVELGILEPTVGRFPRRDVLRARVVEHLAARGIAPEDVARGLASGELTLGYLEAVGRRPPRSDRTFEELSAETGLPFSTLQRMYVAFGFPAPHPDERIREEDIDPIRGILVLHEAGVGEVDLLRIARVWGESTRRVARYQSHYLHTAIEEPFRRKGLGDNAAFEAAIREVGLRVGRSGEGMLTWLYRRHGESHHLEHAVQHVEAALERAGVRSRPGASIGAAVFADLTGYTDLTERAGDDVAVEVSVMLAQLVLEVAGRHRGDVVKMLGDGVHLHFADPGDAVRASLEIVGSVEARGLPPAHVGVNAGPMIYEEGDWFGATVNVAARIASHARPGQVLLGEAVVPTVTPAGFSLREVGALELKGVGRPVTVFEAAPAS